MTITLAEAETQLEHLIQQVNHGEEVILTKNNLPVAKLVPMSESQPPRKAGSARGLFTIAEDFDAPLTDFKEYQYTNILLSS